MKLTEEIADEGGRVLAYIIPRTARPERTTFITPPENQHQVGFIVYRSGGEVARHRHKRVWREIHGTSEVLLVRSGLCEVTIYDNRARLVATRRLEAGDTLLLVDGGHGIRMVQDTVLLEVKQGPYLGLEDKEHF
jgi:hypothetical protein